MSSFLSSLVGTTSRLNLRYTFTKADDQTGVLQLRVNPSISTPFFLFALAGYWFSVTFPHFDKWKFFNWKEDWLWLHGGILLLSLVASLLIVFINRKAFTGELVIDGKSGKILVREGLWIFSQRTFRVPPQGVVCMDTYQIARKNHSISFFRLWLFTENADRGLFAQLCHLIGKYKDTPLEEAPRLPAQSINIIETRDYALLRILAESIAKTMNRDIFDFTTSYDVHRQAEHLDQSFSRATVLPPLTDENAAKPQGIKAGVNNTIAVVSSSIISRIAMTLLVIVNFGALGWLFYVPTEHTLILFLAGGLMVAIGLAINTVTILRFNEKGIIIFENLFGHNISKKGLISWHELEEVRVKKGESPQLFLLTDRQLFSVATLNDAAAQWLAEHLRELTPIRRSA